MMGWNKSILVEGFVTRSATEWSGVVREALGLNNPVMASGRFPALVT
jgi:hypothetical protein